jgi:hypothetical protein
MYNITLIVIHGNRDVYFWRVVCVFGVGICFLLEEKAGEMLRSEGELLRAAEEYRAVQQQKQVKNSFSCKGLSQASMEELAQILDQREVAMKSRNAVQRHVDINRVGVDKSGTPLVALSTTESVLRGDFSFDPPATKSSGSRDTVAAVSIDAMSVLQSDITQLFRTLLLRARFEGRMAAARTAIASRGRQGDDRDSLVDVGTTDAVAVGPLVSLSMVNVASSPTAAATGAFPTYALNGPHSNFVIEGGTVLEEAAPLRKAADYGHFFSAVRNCELAGESSLPKRAKEPLQFKLKSYRFHPNLEGGSRQGAYTFSFPTNPLLQTTSSLNEDPSSNDQLVEKESVKPGLKVAHVPPIEHFVQPLATLETFPFQQPQIGGFLPKAPHVEATSLCPQTCHLAPGFSVTASELATASYQSRVANWTSAPIYSSLTSSSSTPIQPVYTSMQARQRHVPIATPESIRDTLESFDPVDELSDSDDEGDVDIGVVASGPKFGVSGLLQSTLPSLSSESNAAMRHRTVWVPHPQQI